MEENKKMWDFDDVDLAMILIAILSGIGIFYVSSPANIIISATTALAALARGMKSVTKKDDKPPTE